MIPACNYISLNYNKRLYNRPVSPGFGGNAGATALVYVDSAMGKAAKINEVVTPFHGIGYGLNNLTEAINNGLFDSYGSIQTTPILKSVGSHGYAPIEQTRFCCTDSELSQFISALDNRPKGIKFVWDLACINDSYKGFLLDVMRNGKDSPFASYFTLHGNGITLGLYGTSEKARENAIFNIINSRYKYEQQADGIIKYTKNENYNPNRPTEVAIGDSRYLDEKYFEDLNGTYSANPNTPHEIHSYMDSTTPLTLPFPDDDFLRNVKLWNSNIKNGSIKSDTKMYSLEGGQNLLQSKNFDIDIISAARGYDGWYNRMNTPQKTRDFNVIDMDLIAALHPARLNHNIRLLNRAKKYTGAANVENSLTDFVKDDFIKREIVKLPLGSIEFYGNITRVLDSPYIAKRAFCAEDIGKSRLDTNIENIPEQYRDVYKKMSNFYYEDVYKFESEVLDSLNNELPEKLFDNGKITKYGEYALPIIIPNITKYSFIKALAPNIEIALSTDKKALVYDVEKLRETSLESLNIHGSSIAEEAPELFERLKYNYSKNNKVDEIKNIVKGMLENTSVTAFDNAQKTIKNDKLGMVFRIDAFKDVENYKALGGKTNSTVDEQLDNMVSFWKPIFDNIRKEFPDVEFIAEETDFGLILSDGASKKFATESDLKRYLREELGLGEVSYAQWYSDIPNIVNDPNNAAQYFRTKMGLYINEYNFSPSDAVISKNGGHIIAANANNNQLMLDNPDQLRHLHWQVLNKKLFESRLETDDSKKIATKVLNCDYLGEEKILSQEEYDQTHSAAIAMAYKIRDSFAEKSEISATDKEALEVALSDLAKGKFKGEDFVPYDYGVKPVDMAIISMFEQAKYNAQHGGKPFSMDEKQMHDWSVKIYRDVMSEAIEKYLTETRLMTVIPGNPAWPSLMTSNLTGYERTGNAILANRYPQYIRIEEAFPELEGEFNKIISVYKNPNLKALSDGDYKMLPQVSKETTMLRENETGNSVLTVTNLSENNLSIKCIRLSYEDNSNPSKYLKEGDRMTDLDGNKYKVVEDSGLLYIVRMDKDAIAVSTGKDNSIYLYKSTTQDLNSQAAINAYSSAA